MFKTPFIKLPPPGKQVLVRDCWPPLCLKNALLRPYFLWGVHLDSQDTFVWSWLPHCWSHAVSNCKTWKSLKMSSFWAGEISHAPRHYSVVDHFRSAFLYVWHRLGRRRHRWVVYNLPVGPPDLFLLMALLCPNAVLRPLLLLSFATISYLRDRVMVESRYQDVLRVREMACLADFVVLQGT